MVVEFATPVSASPPRRETRSRTARSKARAPRASTPAAPRSPWPTCPRPGRSAPRTSCVGALTPGPGGLAVGVHRLRIGRGMIHGRADLEAVLAGEQAADLEQVVEVVGLDAVEAGELLHGLGERPGGDPDVVEVAADDPGLAGVGELRAADELVAALAEQLHEAVVPVVHGGPLLLGGPLPGGLVAGQQDDVL